MDPNNSNNRPNASDYVFCWTKITNQIRVAGNARLQEVYSRYMPSGPLYPPTTSRFPKFQAEKMSTPTRIQSYRNQFLLNKSPIQTQPLEFSMKYFEKLPPTIKSDGNATKIPKEYCQPGAKVKFISDQIAPEQIEDVCFGFISGPSKFYVLLQEDASVIDFFDRKLQSEKAQMIPGTNVILIPAPKLLINGLPVLIKQKIKVKVQVQRLGLSIIEGEHEVDNWFRAIIINQVVDNNNSCNSEPLFQVFTMDTGEEVIIPLSEIRYLRADLLDEMPAQAILAQVIDSYKWDYPSLSSLFLSWIDSMSELPMVAKFLSKSFDEKVGLNKWIVKLSPAVKTQANVILFNPLSPF